MGFFDFAESAIKLAYKNTSVIGEQRHKNNQYIINKYYNGMINGYGQSVRYISYWQLYSSLATLYEKEHNYEIAVKYLKRLPPESNYQNISDFTRCGNALMMIDTQLCIDYYKDLMNDPKLEKFKKEFKQRYSECLAELREEQSQRKRFYY